MGQHAEGVQLTCWVVPGAARSELKGVHGDALKVRVAAPPEGGRANTEVCRLLGDAFGCTARLIAGGASRRKVVLLVGATAGGVQSTWDSLGLA